MKVLHLELERALLDRLVNGMKWHHEPSVYSEAIVAQNPIPMQTENPLSPPSQKKEGRLRPVCFHGARVAPSSGKAR